MFEAHLLEASVVMHGTHEQGLIPTPERLAGVCGGASLAMRWPCHVKRKDVHE